MRRKTVPAVLTAVVLALLMSLTSSAEEKEKHPEIRAAMQHLREAKHNLENAAHDFGGHRAAALHHVDEALEECNKALAYDKK